MSGKHKRHSEVDVGSDPEFKLRVRHSVTTHEEDALNETGYLVTYEILKSGIPDLPIELFLFHRARSQRTDLPPRHVDSFISVCTLSDVFEYPPNEPVPEKSYFRKAEVKGVLPSLEEANRMLLRMEDLLTSLLRSVKLIHTSAVTVEREIKV